MVESNRSKRRKPSISKPPAQSAGGRQYFGNDSNVRFKPLIACLVFVVAICVLYPGLVFQHKIFFASDNQAAVSFGTVAERAIEEGVYPVWNPYVFAGMPSFASLSYTPHVYPVTAVLKLFVDYLHFPVYLWLFFHTFMAGLGTYLLLRDRGVWFIPSVAAGVLMMWMPNLVAAGAYGHGSQACAVGYMPFALLFWDRLWRGKGILVYGSALAIVFGFSMLRGHLQISYYTYALVALHLLFFGGARFVDAHRGHVPEGSALPRQWFARLTGGGARYGSRTAAVEFAWGAVVFAIVVGMSLAISAVLYLPAHEYAQYSIRGASQEGGAAYSYATSWSLHPLEVLTFLFPYAFGFGKDLYIGYMPFTDYPNYVGLVVLAGAVMALAAARSRFVWFLAFVAAVATLVSFGRFFPVLYGPLFKLAPYFNKFRVPVMVLIVQQLALVGLFGIGLTAMLRAGRERARRNAVLGLAVAFFVFMIVMLTQGVWSGPFAETVSGNVRSGRNPQEQLMVARVVGNYLFRDLVRFSIMLAVLLVLLFAYYSRKLPALVLGVLVLVLGMVDFYLVNRNILHPEVFREHEALRIIVDPSVRDRYTAPDTLIDFLRKDERPFRVFPIDSPQRPFSGLFSSNRFMMFGISSIGGYHPAKLKVYEEYLQAAAGALSRGDFAPIDALNVRYLVSASQFPQQQRYREVWSGTDFEGVPRYVYENATGFPRAWLVQRYRVAPGQEGLDLIASGEVDLSKTVLLEAKPPAEPETADSASVGSVDVTKLGFNEIRLETTTASPALLVLGEVYYPDWKAQVDGEPVEVLQANHIMRAVPLAAGEHEVMFHYDTSHIRRGLLISATSLGVMLVALAIGIVLSTRRRIASQRA